MSEDHSSAVVFVAGAAYSGAAPEPSAQLSAGMTVSYPDGTWEAVAVPLDRLRISTVGEGTSAAEEEEEAFSWVSLPDLSDYVIRLDMGLDIQEKNGGGGRGKGGGRVTGEIHLSSLAPPHVKCGPTAVEGASLADAENILWINPVPDAVAAVNIEVNGTLVEFKGSGYHDKVSYLSIPYVASEAGP